MHVAEYIMYNWKQKMGIHCAPPSPIFIYDGHFQLWFYKNYQPVYGKFQKSHKKLEFIHVYSHIVFRLSEGESKYENSKKGLKPRWFWTIIMQNFNVSHIFQGRKHVF